MFFARSNSITAPKFILFTAIVSVIYATDANVASCVSWVKRRHVGFAKLVRHRQHTGRKKIAVRQRQKSGA
jgi:hypothetical protein